MPILILKYIIIHLISFQPKYDLDPKSEVLTDKKVSNFQSQASSITKTSGQRSKQVIPKRRYTQLNHQSKIKRLHIDIPIEYEPEIELEQFPDEIILQVFSYLDMKELILCGQVSKRMRNISHDESLWQRINLHSKVL